MKHFEHSPLISGRERPDLADALYSLRRRGKVWCPLPGVFAPIETEDNWQLRVAAAQLWAPGHAIVGEVAARMTWWDSLQPSSLELWGPKRKSPAPWLTIRRATLPADWMLWHDDMKLAAPALSAVQAAKTQGGAAIDEALRRKVATVEEMREALGAIAGMKGNTTVHRILRESKRRPWSELEREAHRLLNRARIKGWRGNVDIQVPGGFVTADIVFTSAKLIVELDGWQFHSSREAFRSDRERQNLLTLQGWTVLRFTWGTLDMLVPQVLAALKRAA